MLRTEHRLDSLMSREAAKHFIDMPAAAVQWGTYPRQRTVVATVTTLADVGNAATFLASDRAGATTGTVFNLTDEGPLALQVAYSLARARVLMARGDGEGIDGAAVSDTVERAVGELENVRRVRQQLTGAKTQIDKASEIVGDMSDRVRAHLDEIAALVHAAPASEPVDAQTP